MSILLAILGKTWPYLICLLGGFIGGVYLTYHIDTAKYEELRVTFEAYQARVEANAEAAQRAAREALQAQLITTREDDANNSRVIQSLQDDARFARRQRDDLASRLRNALPNCPIDSGRGAVPEAAVEPGATGAGRSASQPTLADLCADVDAEDRENGRRLNALIAEIKPQL